MTQPTGVAPEEREVIEPVYGFSEEALEEFEQLTVDATELSEGGLADIEVTLIGFDTVAGGDTRTRQNEDGTSEDYQTQDQIRMHFRIDNPDPSLEFTNTTDFFSLPKGRVVDGKMVRGAATSGSKWGIWLSSLHGLGVASVESDAYLHHLKGFKDLIGMKFQRKRTEFPGFQGRPMPVNIPVEIFGWDNGVRKDAKLPAIEMKST